MADLIVTTREGLTRTLAANAELSIMEVIREGGIDELLAVCGGGLSCATCHVIVDPAQVTQLPLITDDEEDLLDGLTNRAATSRLSCQIPFHQALNGLRVTIAPEN